MEFSDNFKKVWWVFILVIVSVYSFYNIFYIKNYDNIDLLLFVFWIILIIFPLISEVSVFGINVKKSIEKMKNDLMISIRQEFTNINNINLIINTAQANAKEKKEQIISKIEEYKSGFIDSTFSDQVNVEEKIFSKLVLVEDLVSEYLRSEKKNDEKYLTQRKLLSCKLEKNIIFDGLFFKGDKIKEIIEIKFLVHLGKSEVLLQ